MKNANTGHSDVNVRQAGRMAMSGFMAAVLMLSTFIKFSLLLETPVFRHGEECSCIQFLIVVYTDVC